MERPRLAGVRFQSIGQQDNVLLVACFEEKEMKVAVWDCGSVKSSGSDGLNFKFIKEF